MVFSAISTMLLADSLKIGVFTLPYRFEDENISDIVRHVATNDVIAFHSATTSFTPPYLEKTTTLVDNETTPASSFYHPALFENGVAFTIENGQTNCVIRSSLTDAAKAIEGELPMRTNLAFYANQFLDSIMERIGSFPACGSA